MDQAAAPEESARTRRLSATARIGLAAVLATVVARIILGSFVVNDWEGWGTFVGISVAVIVEGLVLGGLVFGVGVRFTSRASERRRVVAALVFGLLAVLSLAIPYSAPQPVIGAAAIALGLSATRQGRARSASAGLLLQVGHVQHRLAAADLAPAGSRARGVAEWLVCLPVVGRVVDDDVHSRRPSSPSRRKSPCECPRE